MSELLDAPAMTHGCPVVKLQSGLVIDGSH
jgi:hypothetical protein